MGKVKARVAVEGWAAAKVGEAAKAWGVEWDVEEEEAGDEGAAGEEEGETVGYVARALA